MNGTFSSLFLTFWHLRFQNDALTLGSGDFIDRLIELKKRHEAGKIHLSLHTKSQKPRQRVSNAYWKVFANPESLNIIFIIG